MKKEYEKMNILHLSDIHFGRNYPEYGIVDDFENKDKILNELITCIANIEDKMKPEHIVVTGDIAWWGKCKDYEEAYVWFQKMLDALGLTGKDITFCVGNHDVNRAYNCANRDLKDEEVERIDDIYSYEKVHEMEPPIYEYDRFCEKMGMEPYMYPLNGKMEYSYSLGYKDVKFESGSTIRFVAFNTALLSCLPQMNDDRMWIGQKQILSLMKYGMLPSKETHYTIALFHHAERFLNPREICQYDGRVATLPLLKDQVDLVLCGHTETGGRPVLQKQMGGSLLLTGGAAYFSDNHANAFSMIYIPDNQKDMIFTPYTYEKNWKKYEYGTNVIEIEQIEDIPPLGDIKDDWELILSNDNEEYKIPIKILSIFTYNKDGKDYLRIDNRKEVLRELNIECEAGSRGEFPKFDLKIAPKMQYNVSAMLKRDEMFNRLSDLLKKGKITRFMVKNSSGVEIYRGDNVEGNFQKDEVSVEILSKLLKIEEYFDVKLYRPDEMYELDMKQVDLLIQLIEDGYTTDLKLGVKLDADFCDLNGLKRWYEQVKSNNNFCLVYEKEFKCKLYGVEFALKPITIYAGPYHVDKKDLAYKIKSFREGDCRKCVLHADKGFQTYFISDMKLAAPKITLNKNHTVFEVGNMNLNFGYIYENR